MNNELNKLYKAQGRKDFIPCGIPYEETYLQSRPRVVFLMKEVNSKNLGWDLPNFLRSQIKKGTDDRSIYRTWKPVGMWSYGIQNNFPSFNIVKSNVIIAEGLRSIAMTNLKKSRGGTVSTNKDIRMHTLKDKELWIKELEIMNPDIIVCCATLPYIQHILGLECKLVSKDKLAPNGYYYAKWEINGHNALLVGFYHPGAHFKWKELYNNFKGVLLILRDKDLW